MALVVSKRRRAWPGNRNTENRSYNTIPKYSIEILPKPFHIDVLVFLKIDSYHMKLFLAFTNKVRYFGATFGTLGIFLNIFSNNLRFTHFLDFVLGMGEVI